MSTGLEEYIEFSNTKEELERAFRLQDEERYEAALEKLREFGEGLSDKSWSKPRKCTGLKEDDRQ